MNNEPAFPATEAHGLNSGTYGMTLRDYFAAKVVQGIVASPTTAPNAEFEQIAKLSYAMADAMMKAREVNHEAA